MNSTSHADRVIRARWARYRDFAKVLKYAKRRYTNAAKNQPHLAVLSALHSLCVTPGGAQGGGNDRLLEVFFGQRPFETYKNKLVQLPNGSLQRQWGSYTEFGARLVYVRRDDGLVECRLYPAATENSLDERPDYLLRPWLIKPRDLRRPSTPARHLRWLTVYMAETSLDGAVAWEHWYTLGRLQQRVSLWCLRYFWPFVQDNKRQDARCWTWGQKLGNYILTISLSGGLLWAIDNLRHPPAAAISETTNHAAEDLQFLQKEIIKAAHQNNAELSAILAQIKNDSVARAGWQRDQNAARQAALNAVLARLPASSHENSTSTNTPPHSSHRDQQRGEVNLPKQSD